MAWCDDPNHKKYNEEIHAINKKHKEKFYRTDHIYDYLITISHNEKKIPYKGSAIFLHLTKRYKKTAGCIALSKKDFLIYPGKLTVADTFRIGCIGNLDENDMLDTLVAVKEVVQHLNINFN